MQKKKISKQIGALMAQGKKEEAEEVKKQVESMLNVSRNFLKEKKKLKKKSEKNHDGSFQTSSIRLYRSEKMTVKT